MAVESSFEAVLFQNLKLDEPWIPPKPWESIPSESGLLSQSSLPSSSTSHDSAYHPSFLSEESLVRLVMNALQGVQSALISIQKLSASFCAVPADRSALRVPNLWNRSLSTSALGHMLKPVGYTGCLVFLLQKFVEYFIDLSYGVAKDTDEHPSFSLVNHAFAVAVEKILEGYVCGLNTMNAAAHLRRSIKDNDELSNDCSRLGCLTSIVHSGVTVMEVYLHSKELRTRIEALGNLCNLCDVALCFSVTPIEDLITTATMEFSNFPRGGNLLTYLYDQLQVIDPVNSALLKILFLRSLEPYCDFVRSWIYEAKISDPHGEFIIKHDGTTPAYSHGKAGILNDIPLATVREQDGTSVPCFLKKLIIPLLRAGQQLQVVMKLLDVCKYIAAGDNALVDVLPCSSSLTGYNFSYMSPLSFNKRYAESVVLSRKAFYRRMLEKLENVMKNLEIKYQQGVFHDKVFLYADDFGATVDPYSSSALGGTLNIASATDLADTIETAQNEDFETSSMSEDFGLEALESSDCSSTDVSVEQSLSKESTDRSQIYLSTLRFSSDVMIGHSLGEALQSHEQNSVKSDFLHTCDDKDQLFNFTAPFTQATPTDHTLHFERTVQLSKSWLSEIQYPDNEFHLGGLVGSGIKNLSKSCGNIRVETAQNIPENDQSPEANSLYFRGKYAANCFLEADKSFVDDTWLSSKSYILQSWNDKYQNDVLSMNPILRKSPFCSPSIRFGDRDSVKISKSFTFFDFSYVADPLQLYKQRLTSGTILQPGFQNPVASVLQSMDGYTGRQDAGNDLSREKSYLLSTDSSLISNSVAIDVLPDSAYSAWENMLCGACCTIRQSIGNRTCDCQAIFEMPLDFVIDKCLLQEILLQYNYVSRLTIQFLEKGFDLQEHFLALRRYHFMEKADWADIFVISLWHHNWCFNEAERRTSETQRLLQSSIQRSSCDRDAYKNLLYVYDRNDSLIPALTTAKGAGVHSFDFIGLGYRVNWPVNIVLTPNALRIYAEIFTFLIQVKLAALSLTDIWYSLKDFRHMDSRSCYQHQIDWNHFNILMKLRHQVNHFVSIFQQYVLSQLSDVSWCKFLHFKQEVKDMMDLESVHMSYLIAALHACFLTDEAQPISNIIASILQCALDFRYCLEKKCGSGGGNMGSLATSLPHINISKVVSIKEKFYKSMRELHMSHLKSPERGEFGLSRFWSYLNYNEYYSDVTENTMRHYGLQGR